MLDMVAPSILGLRISLAVVRAEIDSEITKSEACGRWVGEQNEEREEKARKTTAVFKSSSRFSVIFLVPTL